MLKILPAWITLPLLVFLYKPLCFINRRLDKDSYVRLTVDAGNRYYAKHFTKIPYQDRLLFLPYCLRSSQCPTIIDPDEGMLCPPDCKEDCRLGRAKNTALALGYMKVFIVVSGRMHKKEGVLRSRDFLSRQIKKHQPRGVIGCLCTRDLKEKYLRPENISPDGTLGKQGTPVIPQVCLLKNSRCKQSDVDWQELYKLIYCPDHPQAG